MTERQLEVLTLAAIGLSNQQIASRLNIMVTTVRNHFFKIYTKLNASNRAHAVYKAVSWEWIEREG